jgi:hypothetical protein
MVRTKKLEDDPIGPIDAEAPDFMVLGVELFALE